METPSTHQVFISFRGIDVRDGFLSFLKEDLLNKGVPVVTDDDGPRGKRIKDNLQKLIRSSKVAIVMFSENFSNSESCMDELAMIDYEMKLKKLEPLPVFFAVETSHVKLQFHNPFKDFLLRLEDDEREKARNKSLKALKEAEERFLSWREAIKSITDCTGLTYKTGFDYLQLNILLLLVLVYRSSILTIGFKSRLEYRTQNPTIDTVVFDI